MSVLTCNLDCFFGGVYIFGNFEDLSLSVGYLIEIDPLYTVLRGTPSCRYRY